MNIVISISYNSGYITTFKNDGYGKVKINFFINSGLYAFIFNNNDDYFTGKLIENDEFINNLSSKDLKYVMLFFCEFNVCTETNGFIKYYDINKKRVEVNYCDHNYYNKEITTSKCTEADIAYYDSETSKFMLCVRDEKSINNYNAFEIARNQTYLALKNYDNMKYSILISDVGGNIIGYSQNSNIFYLIFLNI